VSCPSESVLIGIWLLRSDGYIPIGNAKRSNIANARKIRENITRVIEQRLCFILTNNNYKQQSRKNPFQMIDKSVDCLCTKFSSEPKATNYFCDR
jgi:hypothetical protein